MICRMLKLCMAYYMVLPFCVALIKNEKGEILVGQHGFSERKPYPGFWDLPGGKLENGETPEDCIKREIQEELGVTVTSLKLLSVFHHGINEKLNSCTSDITSIGMCFECKIEGAIVPTEQDNVHYASREELAVLELTPWCASFVKV